MIFTNPKMLINTATSFDNVSLSPVLLGKQVAKNNTNKLDADDNTVTIPASA